MKKKMMPKNNNLSKVLLILAVVVIASVVYFNYSDSIQKAPPTSAIQRYPSCGNRICDVDVGETFNNCPSDCSANPSSTNDCPNGKPGPENTGYKVPLGQLIPYTGPMTITTPGTIIGNKIITGHLRIDADYVTVKNSEINGYIGIYPNVAGTTIDNVFMDCSGYNYCIQSPSSSDGIKIEDSTFKNAISSHIVGSSMRILRNEFSDSGEDAIKLLPGAEKDTVEGNWVHNIGFTPGSHSDAIQISGGDAHIECNNLEVRGGNSGVYAKQSLAPIDNLLIRKNWINGGLFSIMLSHNINLPGSTNVRVEENMIGNGCMYLAKGGDMSLVTSCGNTWADSGVSVSDNDPNGGCSANDGSASGWTQTYEICP